MTAPAKAAPMREDVTQADRAWVVLAISMIERDVRLSELTDDEIDTLIVASRHRLAHTARPDAGDEDVERVARVIELAVIRHGVEESDLEGTLDDARAALAALAPPPQN